MAWEIAKGIMIVMAIIYLAPMIITFIVSAGVWILVVIRNFITVEKKSDEDNKGV